MPKNGIYIVGTRYMVRISFIDTSLFVSAENPIRTLANYQIIILLFYIPSSFSIVKYIIAKRNSNSALTARKGVQKPPT